MKNDANTTSGLSFMKVKLQALCYLGGKCPYYHDVLLSDTLLAVKHFLHIQRIKPRFRLFVV